MDRELGKLQRAILVLGTSMLMATVGASTASASERVDVLIGFTGRPGAAERAQVAREGGRIAHTYRLVPAVAASVPERAVARLRAQRNVAYVEPDGVFHTVDAELDNTWGVKRIGAGTVHDGGQKGLGVKVAVIDSGIDTDHPDLTWDSACSYDFVDDDLLPEDGNGHGTHTAGTIAALDNNAGVVGASPAATLCIYRVLNNSGSGSFSDVTAALDRAVLDGVAVTNNSYGSSGDPGVTVKAAFDNAYSAGLLHAAAAGNSGNPAGKGSNCIYPALWGSVIATGATTQSDSRASFSSTCAELELAAPGASINSTVPGGGYGTKSGTSMASPHVAGTAALVIGATGWDNATARQRLQETSQDLGSSGRDSLYGFGLVRADLAVPSEPPTTGSVTGTVTDASTGSAIAGATVSTDTGGSTTTAGDGTYTLTDVPTGDRSVTASADGYEPQTNAATVSDGATTTVNFALNAPPTGSVSGTVTSAADGTPIANATVSVDTGGSTTTGTDGTYTLTDIPTGDRFVTASADGFTTQTKTATVQQDLSTVVDIALAPKQTASTATVDSISYANSGGPGGNKHLNIAVHVVDDAGNPIEGASVSIDLYRDGALVSSGTGTTDATGTATFSLKNAASGCYETTVTSVTASGATWDGVTPANGVCK